VIATLKSRDRKQPFYCFTMDEELSKEIIKDLKRKT